MTSLSRGAKPARGPGVLSRQAKPDDPALVLLNPRSGEYYTLDSVGTRIWQLCDGKVTVAEIATIVSREYEAPTDVIENDVVELLEELIDEALVVSTG